MIAKGTYRLEINKLDSPIDCGGCLDKFSNEIQIESATPFTGFTVGDSIIDGDSTMKIGKVIRVNHRIASTNEQTEFIQTTTVYCNPFDPDSP